MIFMVINGDLPSGYDIHSSPWFVDGPPIEIEVYRT